MVTISAGKLSFPLCEAFDFAFLSRYGEPFCVYDQQDSGNLCFGVSKGAEKRFIKIAGAKTVRSVTTPEEAIHRMRKNAMIYRDLAHESLTPLLSEEEIKGGYLLCFEWFEGVSMGMQYETHKLFPGLPFEERLLIFDTILRFHIHVHEKGYVAIDFYDGAVMYDLKTKTPMICDIEMYQKAPVINEMGRMWGSSRFMSPEEFALGAVIDETTNVFCMGAMAFCLFGDSSEKTREYWRESDALFAVAQKATEPERARRYPSVAAFYDAWEAAL